MSQSVKNFIWFAVFGLVLENLFTGVKSVMNGDPNATTHSFLWMIPIWGVGGTLMWWFKVATDKFAPSEHHRLGNLMFGIGRTLIILLGILAIELVAGEILQCLLWKVPWDYGDGPWVIDHCVNLHYLPYWMLLAAYFEKNAGVAEP